MDNTDRLNSDIEDLKRQIKEFELNKEKDELKHKVARLLRDDSDDDNNNSKNEELDSSLNFIYEHLSKIVFILLLFGTILLLEESLIFSLGSILPFFIPYWILKLLLSASAHQKNKGKFSWNKDNYWLIIPLVLTLWFWLAAYGRLYLY
jgi:hypothetical protein